MLLLLLACADAPVPAAPPPRLRSAGMIRDTPLWSTTHGESGADFGIAVAAAGDLNGDGYGDLVAGAPLAGAGDEGEARVFYGSPSGPSATTVLLGTDPEQHLGTAVALGDANGDGYGDLAVGAPFSAATANSGQILLYFGSAAGVATTADAVLTEGTGYDSFGSSLGPVDINGDGAVDLIVGCPEATFNGDATGYVRTYFWDGAGGFSAVTGNLYGNAGDRTGHDIAAGPDLNGDGYGDMVFGVPLSDNSQSNSGKAYVYYGHPSWPNSALSSNLAGNQDNGWFGWSVDIPGDLDADGLADLVIGAPFEDGNSHQDAGCVHVYYGEPGYPVLTADVVLCGDAPYQSLGAEVHGAGDLDADGSPELLLGAPFADAATGRVWLYTSAPGGLNSTPVAELSGGASNENFGAALAGAGDTNGDGYGEVLVGVPRVGGQGSIHLYNLAIDRDGDGVFSEEDCDDLSALSYPGADERCDDLDNDCDARIDEGEPIGASTFYRDADGDGVGDPNSPVVACVQPNDCTTNADDCDDGDASIFPGAAELCDDIDEDCDARVDEAAGDMLLWYADADADGWGLDTEILESCEEPAGRVAQPGDCDDANGDIFPGAPEVFGDGLDNDCDGLQATAQLSGGCGGCGGANGASTALPALFLAIFGRRRR